MHFQWEVDIKARALRILTKGSKVVKGAKYFVMNGTDWIDVWMELEIFDNGVNPICWYLETSQLKV